MLSNIKLIVISLFCMLSSVMQGKVFLVSVGVADYPGTQNDLLLPDDDASTMNWLCKKNNGATTSLFLNDRATVSAVKSEMDRMFSLAGADDVVMFFFSGHGSPGCFHCYDGQLTYDMVRDCMKKSRSKHKVVIADACFSGGIRQNTSSTHSNQSAYASYEMMFFLSSRGDEYSIEKRTMKNGLFTAYVSRGLRGGADVNKDRRITAKELFDYVSKGVKSASGDKQHPVMWGKFDNNMAVMSW